jgi:4-carboxymuconolactone decarboxylase
MPVSNEPRLAALTDAELQGPAIDVIKNWNLNLHRTLAHSPEMLGLWLPWAEQVLRKNSLPERDRELVILRVAIAWNSNYEWGLHAVLALNIGMTQDDLHAIARGSSDSHWDTGESALLAATDEVLDRKPISDQLWTVLASRYTPRQLIDYMMTIAEFSLVAMILTTLRIPLENRPGLPQIADYL